MNNKGSLIDNIYIIIIMFIVAIVLIGSFWFIATTGPLVVGFGKQLTGDIQNKFLENGNDTSLANATIVAVKTTDGFLGLIEVIVYFAFLGLLFGYIAVCYYVRTYKWLSMVWISLVIGLVVIAMILSHSYNQAKLSNTDMTSFYNTWGTSDFLMSYLPYIVGMFGFISGIILFAIISTDSEEETKII